MKNKKGNKLTAEQFYHTKWNPKELPIWQNKKLKIADTRYKHCSIEMVRFAEEYAQACQPEQKFLSMGDRIFVVRCVEKYGRPKPRYTGHYFVIVKDKFLTSCKGEYFEGGFRFFIQDVTHWLEEIVLPSLPRKTAKNKKPLTIEQCKDKVAKKAGWKDWLDMRNDYLNNGKKSAFASLNDEVNFEKHIKACMELYASQNHSQS